jgi:hypothetical protein
VAAHIPAQSGYHDISATDKGRRCIPAHPLDRSLLTPGDRGGIEHPAEARNLPIGLATGDHRIMGAREERGSIIC